MSKTQTSSNASAPRAQAPKAQQSSQPAQPTSEPSKVSVSFFAPESNQLSETQNQSPEANQTTERPSKLKTLADILRDPTERENAQAGETPASGAAAEKPQKTTPPKALKDLAERLELKPEDLYAIEVPFADGKVRTIGQLKDFAAKEEDLSVRELQIEEDRTRKESEFLRAREELRELFSALPEGAVKPDVLEAVRRKHEAILTSERAKTLEVIPEWRDEARRTEEMATMVETLKDFGFPATYLGQLYDHRALKMLREYSQLRQRVRKALEQVQPGKPPVTTGSKPNGAAKKPVLQRHKSVDTNSERLARLFS